MNRRFVIAAAAMGRASDRVASVERHLRSIGATILVTRPDLMVAVDRETAVHRMDPGTMILGMLVRRNGTSGNMSTRDSSFMRARDICGNCWGSFLALIEGEDGVHVMLDPSGGLPAAIAADEDMALASDAIDPALMQASGFRATVNLETLAGSLIDPTTFVVAKLLSDLTPLVGGRLHRLDRRAPERVAWSPADVRTDATAAADRLAGSVDEALDGMSGSHPLVQLSGGLDSSIVAATLVRVRPDACAVTCATSAGDVNELLYARAAARHCAIPLTEDFTDDYPSFADFCEAPQFHHPHLHGLDDLFRTAVDEAARTFGADCVVTGQGGDAVFYRLPTPLIGVDRFRALGLRALGDVIDDARRTRTSIWHHLVPMLSDRLRGSTVPRQIADVPYLRSDARSTASFTSHPWRVDAVDLPPGKQLQIAMLANCQVFHTRRPRASKLPVMHPLLSQPVLERALAIPSWMLAFGSMNRGLARQAFAERLPASIRRRDAKGAATIFYSKAALANLDYLRDLLLGGALSEAGLVDDEVLDTLLTRDGLFHSSISHSLMLLASCEAWLRAWRTS